MHIWIFLSLDVSLGKKSFWLQKIKQRGEVASIRMTYFVSIHDWCEKHAWELWCLRRACLIIESKAEVTATICYEVIVLGETRRDWCCTKQQESFQLRKKENQCSEQNKTRPSSAAWHMIAALRAGNTEQMEEVLSVGRAQINTLNL